MDCQALFAGTKKVHNFQKTGKKIPVSSKTGKPGKNLKGKPHLYVPPNLLDCLAGFQQMVLGVGNGDEHGFKLGGRHIDSLFQHPIKIGGKRL